MRLDAAGVRFHIRRNFENHRISLSRLDANGWIEEIVGEHNPVGRRPNPAYTDWLISLFHHASRELFQSTFCVVQPLPHAERLNAELQALLAGAGEAGGHEAALGRLVEAAKEITKETGALGLTPRDGRKPGKLDELVAEIAALEGEIQASQQTVQGVRETSEAIAELTEVMTRTRERLAAARKSLRAFEAWRRHSHHVRSLSEEVAKLTRAREGYSRQEVELEAAVEKQRRLYPELVGTPQRFGDGLARLEELFGRVGELNRLIEEADRLSRELERLRASRQTMAIPVSPGETAVSWVRQITRDLQEASEAWRDFDAMRRKLGEIHESLATRYAPFEEAAPSTIAAIEGYEEQRSRLLDELERAVRDLERAEAARREVDRAKDRLKERFPRAAFCSGDVDRIRFLAELSTKSDEAKSRLERLRCCLAKLGEDVLDRGGAGCLGRRRRSSGRERPRVGVRDCAGPRLLGCVRPPRREAAAGRARVGLRRSPAPR